MNTAVQHHYARIRAHQMSVWANGGGVLGVYPSGRTEMSYGSAPYGEHAISAFYGAKQHIAFVKRLKADVAQDRKRSRAAKKGTRRAA